MSARSCLSTTDRQIASSSVVGYGISTASSMRIFRTMSISGLYKPGFAQPCAAVFSRGRTGTDRAGFDPVLPRSGLQVRAALTPASGVKATWSQSTSDVVLKIPVADDVKGRDIKVEVHPKRMSVDICGETVLQGQYESNSNDPMVDPDGCYWTMESEGDERFVQITLEKKDMGHESWANLIEGNEPDESFTNYVYFTIKIGEESVGNLVMGLHGHIAPKTVENFLELCRGTTDPETGKRLTYEGSPFHRIIPRFMAQGGDITMGNGTGGVSIYGERFDDENFILKHDQAGTLSMANAGPNTNGSQFFILFEPQSHLDGRHTVFGRVVDEESMKLLRRLEDLGTQSGAPKQPIMISACGELSENPDELPADSL